MMGASKNNDFLLASSMRLTPSGLALKIASGDFVMSARTTARMQEVEQRREQLPRHHAHDCMDAGGTPPWKEVVEPRLERRPRATQDAKAENLSVYTIHEGLSTDDCMDAGDTISLNQLQVTL